MKKSKRPNKVKINSMKEYTDLDLSELRVDGGPTKNGYLMQIQSDIAGCNVLVPNQEELSGIGAAYIAGVALGIWNEDIFGKMKRNVFEPMMDSAKRAAKYKGWKEAVNCTLR